MTLIQISFAIHQKQINRRHKRLWISYLCYSFLNIGGIVIKVSDDPSPRCSCIITSGQVLNGRAQSHSFLKKKKKNLHRDPPHISVSWSLAHNATWLPYQRRTIPYPPLHPVLCGIKNHLETSWILAGKKMRQNTNPIMIPEPWVSQTVTEGSFSCGCLGKKICCGSAGVIFFFFFFL